MLVTRVRLLACAFQLHLQIVRDMMHGRDKIREPNVAGLRVSSRVVAQVAPACPAGAPCAAQDIMRAMPVGPNAKPGA